jgi:hypothetical protein
MTKVQSTSLKCQLSILTAHGEYIYLHVPDNNYEHVDLVTKLLNILKEKLKSNWQTIYWFIWCMIKSFKCKKCTEWFRLTDINKCRLNVNTHCSVHDTKFNNFELNNNNQTQSSSKSCSCIHSDHLLDPSSAYVFFSNSSISKTNINNMKEDSEENIKRYTKFILELFEKKKNLFIIEQNSAEDNSADLGGGNEVTLSDYVENVFKFESINLNSKRLAAITVTTTSPSIKKNSLTNSATIAQTSNSRIDNDSYFLDSITGKHIALVNKHILNLIRLSQLQLSNDQQIQQTNYTNASNNNNNNNNNNNFLTDAGFLSQNLDLISYIRLISKMESFSSVFNCVDVLHFLKIENRQKWELNKPTRLNQDNQRENDLKRFREIANFLIKSKLIEENYKRVDQKHPIASLLINSLASGANSATNTNSSNSMSVGFYCRIENEWKQRPIS